MPTILAELPDELRSELKEPLGAVYTDVEALLADAGDPIVAVGDMVTYHLIRADRWPDVALVDGKTKREAVEREVAEAIDGFDHRLDLVNPAATLTDELLAALVDALGRPGTVVLTVEGEEDLAALPAVLAAPDGAAVVYGQPNEGMVLATADGALRERSRELLTAMEGDYDRLAAHLSE
jgi:uncharacterized protein (UPF0218 family)